MSVVVAYNLPLGLGTNFSEVERPISFASVYTNRFRNVNGGSERRPGMSDFGAVLGSPNLTRLHEFISETGTETLFSSDDQGNVYRYYASAWATVLSGKAPTTMLSCFADGKLIFCNGVDRNFYTDDNGATFRELKPFITRGKLAGGSGPTTVIDGDVSNWIGNTLVANNDIVYNVTRDAYGIVTTVASAALTITTIGTGGTGSGYATSNQASGDIYELLDYVDMNIIPDGTGGYDNVAVATTGTTNAVVYVSGVDFSTTEIRENDIVYNSTRGGISLVRSVSAAVNLDEAISSQAAGDSLVFLKSAMPIASYVHVHYGRVYYLDARRQRRVIISAPDDPEDVTTYQKTLDAASYDFGSQNPKGDTILSMGTFLSYFVAVGKKNLYIYQGSTPIADSATTAIGFTPIATYPNGVASRFGLASDGGSLLHITQDGLQAIGIGYNAYSTNQENISIAVFNNITDDIESSETEDIQLTYYPKRRWLINKIGDKCYILNKNPLFQPDGQQTPISTWHLFTGKWAQQNHYFVRRNGDLVSCGANGGVYFMDNGDATDMGELISTSLKTAWLRLEESKEAPGMRSPRNKEGLYIQPVFESSPGIEYTITARAGLDGLSYDSIAVSAGTTGAIGSAIIGATPIGAGNYAQKDKYPLRWRGQEVQVEFSTQSSAAKDIISLFTLYGNISGRR